MRDTLEVIARTESGSRNCRRLRRAGLVPAILYGHGDATVELAVRKEALEAVIRHGSRFVALSGAVKEDAVVRALQWDALGSHPVHLDLQRVSKADQIRVRVPIDTKGECPGQRAGGTVNLVLHEVELECTPSAIPERIHVPIGSLELGHAIKLKDLELPAGVRALGDPEEPVVTCGVPGRRTVAADEPPATTAEPEVIGRKAAAEEAAESEA